MKGKARLGSVLLCWSLFNLSASMSSFVAAADPGDFDGDGRLSIRDVLLIGETCFDQVPLAPGSLEAFEEFACYEGVPERSGSITRRVGSHGIYIPNAVYIESLRRSVASPLPNYAPTATRTVAST